MDKRKRLALVGAGNRAWPWCEAAAVDYSSEVLLAGLCDPNIERCRDINRALGMKAGVYSDYGKMLAEARPDAVIVTSPDNLHEEHIVKALDAGCGVITEKPLCVNAEQARNILSAEERGCGEIFMAFNYRYIPLVSRVKELLADGVIGRPVSIDLSWRLDYKGHGISYFRRWHRMMKNSGGLLVTKASHHFDIACWFMDDIPETVYAMCGQAVFGPGKNFFAGERCSSCAHAGECVYFTDVNVKQADTAKLSSELGYSVKSVRDYARDYCPFSPQVDIYDTMGLSVQYKNGGLLNYSLFAAAPYEGFNIAVNGTGGRIETGITDARPAVSTQKSHAVLSPGGKRVNGEGYNICEWPVEHSIAVMPHGSSSYEVRTPNIASGHNGGDDVIFRMCFGGNTGNEARPSALDGALSMAIGHAGNISAESGQPVRISDLLGKWAD